MKLREFLLEYDRQVTADRFGVKLWQRIQGDTSGDGARVRTSVSSAVMNEMGLWGNSVPHLRYEEYEARCGAKLVSIIELSDPTPNKQYVQWLALRYLNAGIQYWEDFHRASVYIERHVELRQSGFFKRHPDLNAQYGDLNRIKTLSELGAFLMEIDADAAQSNAAKDRGLGEALIADGDAVVTYDTDTWKVVIPKTKEAAIFFGRHTQWCTSSQHSTNYFDDYNRRGPLYIILNKKTNSRWQFHFQSGQYMNANDEPVEFTGFDELFLNDAFDFKSIPIHFIVKAMSVGGMPKGFAEVAMKDRSKRDHTIAAIAVAGHKSVNQKTLSKYADMHNYLRSYPSDNGTIKKIGGDVRARMFPTPDDWIMFMFRLDDLPDAVYGSEFRFWVAADVQGRATPTYLDVFTECTAVEIGRYRRAYLAKNNDKKGFIFGWDPDDKRDFFYDEVIVDIDNAMGLVRDRRYNVSLRKSDDFDI